METPYGRGKKVCLNGPGHLTNLATMPIYGKSPMKTVLQNQRDNDLGTWYVAVEMWGLPIRTHFIHYAF